MPLTKPVMPVFTYSSGTHRLSVVWSQISPPDSAWQSTGTDWPSWYLSTTAPGAVAASPFFLRPLRSVFAGHDLGMAHPAITMPVESVST